MSSGPNGTIDPARTCTGIASSGAAAVTRAPPATAFPLQKSYQPPAVVGRYKGRIGGWDVVNEALDEDGSLRKTPWLEIVGEDFIAKAFEFAHAADPDAELYYNDYNLWKPAKREAAIRLVRELKAKGLYRRLRVVESEQKSRCVIDGREVITLSSNNYLGLNTHPKLRQAALDAVERFGAGSGAVRTIAGTMSLHEELEARLATFKHTEAVLTFQSGFTANTGVIPILAPEGATIVSDALNHASIIDGIRLTKADRKIFPHADIDGLRQALREVRSTDADRTVLVITDGVFSMDGDIARLPEIVEAAEEADAIVMVDDAHASGVLGTNGRGTVDHFGLNDSVDIICGSMSKSLASTGGFVAASREVIEYLRTHSKQTIFSAAVSPSQAACAQASLELMQTEPEHLQRLWTNTKKYRTMLKQLGLDTWESETPAVPIVLGSKERVYPFWKALLEKGVFTVMSIAPAVPIGKDLIRTAISAMHTDEQLEKIADAMAYAMKKL